MHRLLKQPVWLLWTASPVFVAFSIAYDLHHASAQAASRADSRKKGAGSTSQDWDLPHLQWFFTSYLLHFALKAGPSQSLLAIAFHQAQGCVNLPAQRLHAVFKPSHSMAKPVIAITATSREQEAGTATAARDLDRQRKTMRQSTPSEQQRGLLSSTSSGVRIYSWQHLNMLLEVLLSACPYTHQKQVLFQYFCSVTPSITKLLTGLDLLTRLHLLTHSQQMIFY